MRKITAGLFMSLDGVVESPGEWGFRYLDDEMSERMAAGIAQADAILLGARTYTEFAELWPRQGSDSPMGAFLNNTTKYVVSSTLDTLAWEPARLVTADLAEELTELKNRPGRNIQVPGSPRLVRSLLVGGLLDELALTICPVVVGSGLRLFDDMPRQVDLRLADSVAFRTGAIGVRYVPRGT
jgi:dihydrofolate reductase